MRAQDKFLLDYVLCRLNRNHAVEKPLIFADTR